MLKLLIVALLFALPAAAQPLDAIPSTRLNAELRCLLGSYALPSGRAVSITGSDGHPRDLQFTFSDGRYGTLKAGETGIYTAGAISMEFAPCSEGNLRVTQGSVAESGTHLRLVERETSFESDGLKLHGKLVLPRDGRARALAVWIEGSNNNPSTDDAVWQYELAVRGVAVFVYDKRGTGASAGEPSADFYARARDTAAALTEARRLAPRIRKVGVIGASQGGWVAPLTATLTDLDFVVAAFALADGPIAQDQALVEQQVRQAGFDERALQDARELTAITARIVRSDLREGFAELDAFKAEHAKAPWLKAIQPRSYTGLFAAFSTPQIQSIGPAAAQGLSFSYEPRPIIEAIKPRQLWLLGGQDQQAPNAATQAILREIQRGRSDLAVIVFPKADHGLVESINIGGEAAMAYSPHLFDVTANWIKDRTLPAPGKFITMPGQD